MRITAVGLRWCRVRGWCEVSGVPFHTEQSLPRKLGRLGVFFPLFYVSSEVLLAC